MSERETACKRKSRPESIGFSELVEKQESASVEADIEPTMVQDAVA